VLALVGVFYVYLLRARHLKQIRRRRRRARRKSSGSGGMRDFLFLNSS